MFMSKQSQPRFDFLIMLTILFFMFASLLPYSFSLFLHLFSIKYIISNVSRKVELTITFVWFYLSIAKTNLVLESHAALRVCYAAFWYCFARHPSRQTTHDIYNSGPRNPQKSWKPARPRCRSLRLWPLIQKIKRFKKSHWLSIQTYKKHWQIYVFVFINSFKSPIFLEPWSYSVWWAYRRTAEAVITYVLLCFLTYRQQEHCNK